MTETFAVCPPKLILCELALLIKPARNGFQPHAPRPARGGYALQIIEFLHAKGYQPRYVDREDGRVGAIVKPEAIVGLKQNLINVAFVHDSLNQSRPDMFGN
jgi:hypothetical protein